jgi:Cof subfamily protein (haloacid dehalogenase superfamily)
MLDLICIDVDGTLVGSSGDVLPQVWEAAAAARARGQHLALCTGRPGFGKALDWARQLEPTGWHIFQNGASLARADGSETLSSGMGEDFSLAPLEQQSRQEDWALELYSDFDWTVNLDNDLSRGHADLLGVPLELKAFAEVQGKIVRAQWVVSLEDGKRLLASPLPGLSYHPAESPVMPDALFVSITAAGISKASAIRTLCEQLGTTLERTMMVGDARNDVQALKVVGYPVAMGNADEHAKAVSRHFVGHVDAGGLVEALELSAGL